jgi:hypothetical protein
MLMIAGALLTACAQPAPPETTVRTVQLRSCDDGGSGGVIIDGVCL